MMGSIIYSVFLKIFVLNLSFLDFYYTVEFEKDGDSYTIKIILYLTL